MLVAVVCVLVFFRTTVPMLFLIFPPMMHVAYRGGFVGTARRVLLVRQHWRGGHRYRPWADRCAAGQRLACLRFRCGSMGFIVLQIFVASLLISLFPMIVSLAEGRRAHRATEELQNRLRLLMDHPPTSSSSQIWMGSACMSRPPCAKSPATRRNSSWRPAGATMCMRPTGRKSMRRSRRRVACATRVLVFRVKHTSGAELWVEARMKHFRDRTFDLMQSEKESGMRATATRRRRGLRRSRCATSLPAGAPNWSWNAPTRSSPRWPARIHSPGSPTAAASTKYCRRHGPRRWRVAGPSPC